MHDRLQIRPETLDWTLIPEYKKHQWDGTPNPIKTILELVAAWKWVAVESGVGTGKTFLAACLLLWFLDNFPRSMVVTIAPKGDQLKLHLWKEVTKLYPLFGVGELTTLRLRMMANSDEWMATGFVTGVSADEVSTSATRAQGFHAEHMLIIAEETPGVAEAVLTAFENTSIAPHNQIIAFGNPDHQGDTLHRFANRPHVIPVRISALDHPNVVTKDPALIAGAQTEEGLQKLLHKYKTENHRLYQSRARGISPKESQDALIHWDWCVAAANRNRELAKEGRRAFGVDVANNPDGDKGAIAFGEGSVLYEVTSHSCPNANIFGAMVHKMMLEKGIKAEDVGVDNVGVGAGAVNEMTRLGAHVVGLGGAENAQPLRTEHGYRMQEKFRNLRSQMWWLLRLDLQFGEESGICLPYDEELFADLTTPTWRPENGQIIIEPKEKIKKRLGRSPNVGDAVVYWNWIRTRRPKKTYRFGIVGQPEDQELVNV
jgi:hypothetical protein